MLSEVQKKKLGHLFDVLDENKNGYLQMDDFVQVGERILKESNFSSKSRQGRLILLKASRLFVQLLVDLETDDMKISLYDWISIFEKDMKEDQPMGLVKNYVHRTTHHLFTLFDVNKDHFISKEEYALMLSTYKIPPSLSEASFSELDENGDGHISVQELITAFENFFTSSNPDAPGNLIFGDWK